MMKTILTIFFFFASTIASAQTALLPEPVPSTAAQMFEQLESGDWRNWIEKAEALDYLSRYDVPGAATAVKVILDNKHPNYGWLRGRALAAMTRIDTKNAATLAEAHRQDPHVEVRVAAAVVCANLPKDVAAPIIERLLADKTPLVHFHTLAAHARHQGAAAWKTAEPMMGDIPDNCIEPAARALGWIGTEPAQARLLEIAKKSEAIPALLRGLDGIASPTMATFYLDLIAAHEAKIPISDAWQELQHLDRDLVVAACRKTLASGDEAHVRAVARIIAGHLKKPALGEALQEALEQAKERATMQIGLAALSGIEADRFKDAFAAQLAHEDVQIRTTAVRCLAQCKEVNLYEALEKTLADPQSAVRVAVLESLRNVPRDQVPRERIIEYFTASLLSPDAATRRAAIAAVAPSITLDNGDAALAVMQQMQNEFGSTGTESLMRSVFRMVPEKESASILEAHGYVARWHVIGAFPAGFGAPEKDVDGFAMVYPPEQKVDLNETLTVKYNTKSDTRFGKAIGEEQIGWVPATVGNADGTLYMTKAGRSQLQMPRRNGVCYAYTEITLPDKKDVRLSFLFNMKAQDRVWLNGKVITLESKVDTKQGTATKTAQVTLNAGKNSFLVKVVSNDHSGAWWAPKVSARGFVLSLSDLEGKPVKWSHE